MARAVGAGTPNSPLDYPPTDILAADFSKDSKIDLVVAQGTNNVISLFQGNGDGTFGAAQNASLSGEAIALTAADFSRDGVPDVAVANADINRISILNSGLSLSTLLTTGSKPVALAVGDSNEDGRPDLAVANYDSGTVSILLNLVAGFTPLTNNCTVSPHPVALAAGDFNNDGQVDLAVISEDAVLTILTNRTKGLFATASAQTVFGRATSLVAATLTGIGYVDVAFADSENDAVHVLRGDGHGAFLNYWSVLPPSMAPARRRCIWWR